MIAPSLMLLLMLCCFQLMACHCEERSDAAKVIPGGDEAISLRGWRTPRWRRDCFATLAMTENTTLAMTENTTPAMTENTTPAMTENITLAMAENTTLAMMGNTTLAMTVEG